LSTKGVDTHAMYKINHRINGDGITERRCTMCDEWKEETLDHYYLKNKKKPEIGYTPACRICITAKAIAHRLLNVDRARKSIQDHYYRHKKVYNARAKAYKKDHREKIVNDYKEWIKNNPDKVKIYGLNHRSHEITDEEWNNCLKYFDYKCAYCGISEEDHLKIHKQRLHKEHAADDGANDLRNAIPACRLCNSGKHTSDMEEWYMDQNFFTDERYNKIIRWIEEEFKKYIENRPI